RHHDLHPAEVGFDLGERLVESGRVGDVAREARKFVGLRRARQYRDAITLRGEQARTRQADAARAAGDDDDPRFHQPGSQRITADAQVIPAPKPTSSTRSPGATRPWSTASTRASGIDADDVLPVRSSTTAVRSIGRPSFAFADSMMRMLA